MSDEHAWFPIASSDDLPLRHTFAGKLFGVELAVWRADDGFVNVWHDRCLHRGVRLSIGSNDGAQLRCQYHGWRYVSRSGGCVYIPAHPGEAPARGLCVTSFPAVERGGLVWASLSPDAGAPVLDVAAEPALVLRPVPVRAPAGDVREALERTPHGVRWFVQPTDEATCIVRGIVSPRPPAEDVLTVARTHNSWLTAVRDELESAAAAAPVAVSVRVHVRSPIAPAGAMTRVVVSRKELVAEGVMAVELAPIDGVLPAFQPGAHIDVHLPNGLVRQYSLVNGPRDVTTYRLGIKLEPESTGGSRLIHLELALGTELVVSEPRNNFPLRRDKTDTILVAGGIGITPLLSMAQALRHVRLGFTLHCFAESHAHLAFADVLGGLGDSVATHIGLDPAATGEALRTLLAEPNADRQVYVCGPGPMLDAARRIAAEEGWPDASVHFEYFKNSNVIDDTSAFRIVIESTAQELEVPAGTTALEVLTRNGIPVPSSCQQGACGTCLVRVLGGTPQHHDVYLNDTEKRANDRMLVCVSRAESDRLVLDL